MTIPIVFWIAFMSEPLISLIFERGEFTSESTSVVVIALLGYSARIVIQPIGFLASQFFIMQRKVRFIMYITFLTIGLNFLLDRILLEPFGVGGITASTSLVSLITTSVWVLLVKRRGITFVPWKTILVLSASSAIIILLSMLIRSFTNELFYLFFSNLSFAALIIWSTKDVTKYILRQVASKFRH